MGRSEAVLITRRDLGGGHWVQYKAVRIRRVERYDSSDGRTGVAHFKVIRTWKHGSGTEHKTLKPWVSWGNKNRVQLCVSIDGKREYMTRVSAFCWGQKNVRRRLKRFLTWREFNKKRPSGAKVYECDHSGMKRLRPSSNRPGDCVVELGRINKTTG